MSYFSISETCGKQICNKKQAEILELKCSQTANYFIIFKKYLVKKANIIFILL